MPGGAIPLARVLASADVPEAVYEKHMAECSACPHSRKARDHHWCGCCGCPTWIAGKLSSSLEFKNKKAPGSARDRSRLSAGGRANDRLI